MTWKYLLATALLVAAGPAWAEEIVLKPVGEARLRYETVDQDGIARDADALTMRVRGGLSATSGPWSATAQAQGTLAFVDDYHDGVNGAADRPLIADPENIALYVAQLQYKVEALTLTAGRQTIALDDERFVGPVGFRQNGQSFDAVRAEIMPVQGLKADISYVWSVRTIWGIDGTGARQQAISGDNVLANLSYPTPLGTLTGFAYLVDQDEVAVQGFRLSSQTYGARLAGAQALSGTVKLSYQASYARQADYRRNPNDYHADYYLVDGSLDIAALRLSGGYEVLGADSGAALTSFQTPLATLFKFNGWADKFLTTPQNGLRDLYGGAGYGFRKVGPIDLLSVQAVYHRFGSDRLDQHYGNEIDLLASAKIGRYLVSARYADYDAKRLATDTAKLWLSVDVAL